ncbi:MAG: hypothetical protein KatS3mg120_2428 [Erythrobacter sp.]|nr:MAG: hypothetical protein KatS3mg120_2428 [Erythrobacter sp.]
MTRIPAPRLVAAAALAAALAACSSETPAGAPEAAETPAAAAAAEPGAPVDLAAVVKEREENFEAIGKAFKAVRGELEKDAPDFALIAASANDINARAMKIEGHFPRRHQHRRWFQDRGPADDLGKARGLQGRRNQAGW